MNKRIRELAKEAGFMEAWFSESGDDCEREIKKFAELIVEECTSIAAKFSMENKRFHPDIDPANLEVGCRMVYFSTCWAVSHEIKEHFGVEE